MSKITKILRYFKSPSYRYLKNVKLRGYDKRMDDKKYLERTYKALMGVELNLDNPTTFNEKLQWLKLYDRKPIYTAMVDKSEAKKYVADIIGEEYIIPTIAVYDSFDEINFDALPDKFVLKCTHDSGGLAICKDKNTFDVNRAKKRINKSLKNNFYYKYREWPYKNVKPRIIAEQYMEDSETKELRDYKFFCFDGAVEALFIATDRQKPGEDVKFDFFDAEFNHLDMRQGHENAAVAPNKPTQFEKMKELASKLSCGIPHVRVDFYEVNGRIYFGELTFYHFSGMVPFIPEEWDRIFGSWIILP